MTDVSDVQDQRGTWQKQSGPSASGGPAAPHAPPGAPEGASKGSMSNRATLLTCLAVCVIYVFAAGRAGNGLWGFTPPPFSVAAPVYSAQNTPPFFRQESIPSDNEFKFAHVASLCELPNGGLMAVWYAGTHILARDVAIYGSIRKPGADGWSAPRKIVSGVSASLELRRLVRKVGNPLIWSGRGGRLYLLYASPIGGWSTSSLNLKTSTNFGQTWSRSVRLSLSPFFNMGELVRNKPVALQDGGFLVPIYLETIGKFPEDLWLLPDASEPGGFKVRKAHIDHSRGFLQASVVTLGSRSAIAFLRSAAKPRIAISETSNSGLTWTSPHYIGLPNPNSAICALPISGGRILLAFNDGTRKRNVLRLAVCGSHGQNCRRIATLADSPHGWYAYPYMIRTRNGLFHLVYSYEAKCIKHVTFNESWLEEQIRKARQGVRAGQVR